jgi:GNAT superfamily N-acetyltransferase
MQQSKTVQAKPVALTEILTMRDLYRQEMNCQIVHDSHHARGFTSQYVLLHDGRVAGYGCIGDYDTQGRDVVTEFYVTPEHGGSASELFGGLLAASGASQVQAQTNDRLLSLMLYDFCRHDSITGETLLFADAGDARLSPPADAKFRRIEDSERKALTTRRNEPPGTFGIEIDGEIVGTGGYLCHYNPPYGDVYMEVSEKSRRRGIGSYLVQEIKRVCFEAGKRPSARCSCSNVASRRTLEKAGFRLCARVLRGIIDGTGEPVR